MPTRFLVVLRRSLTRGPAVVLVPALVAGSIVAVQGGPAAPRVERPRTTKVATTPGAGEFVPLSPSRILDTRTTSTPLFAAESRAVSLRGVGGVPTTGVSAVVVVMTAVSPTANGYLTMYPYGITRPVLSHVYFNAGAHAANTVIAKLGTDGKVSVYNSAGSTQLLVDVTGYYTSSSTTTGGGTFVSLAPTRIYSTPDGLNTGTSGTTPYSAAETRAVQITGNAGIPAGAAAVAVNIHATTTTSATSYVQVWPAGVIRPTGSNVQLAGNDTQRGLAVVKLSADGKINVFNSGSTVPIKLDVEGYYLPATSDAAKYYVPLTPARVYSTTLGLNTPGGSTARLGAGATLTVPIRGAKDAAGNVVVPATTAVDAVVASIGVGTPTASSYMTAWTNGETRPVTSMSVYSVGESRAATFFGKLGASGKIDVYNNLGDVSVSVEIQGYYADAAVLPPAAPTNVVGTPGNGSVALSWTAAADNGFPLWSNTVTVKTAAGDPVATYEESAGAVAKTIPGLTNGESYVFTVTAANEAGPGPAATSAAVMPVGPPGAPSNVGAAPGNRSLAVTWGAAANSGSAITGQTVTIRRSSDDGQVVQAPVAADATSRTFTGLTNGTAYYAEVVAANVAGSGPAGRSADATPVYPDAAAYPIAVTADSPTVYYRLGEASGTAAQDASGNSRNGTYATPFTLGASGALVDDPDKATSVTDGGRVQYKAAGGLPVGNAPRTIETWLKTTATTEQHLGGWGTEVSNQRSFLWLTGGSKVTFERWGGPLRVEHVLPKAINDGQWHHLAFTYSGAPDNKTVVYVDGNEVASATIAGGVNTVASSEYLTIGREPNCACSKFTGAFDEFAVYDTALPATRVAAHFAASGITTPQPPQNLTIVPGDGFVTADWDATTAGVPAGATAVTGYVVEATTNGVLRGRIRTAPGTTTSRISGLAAGDYVVAVQGCNAYGCGLQAVATQTVQGGGATYASLVLDDAPLAYLRLGERSGGDAADTSPHRRDAVYGSNVVLGSLGAVGGDPDPAVAGTGAGANALARTHATGFVPTGTAARTVEAWVKGDGAVASWGTDVTRRAFGVRVTGTSFVVTAYGDDLTFTTPVSVADGAWHHAAVTYGGGLVTAYFDGVSLGAGTFATAIDTAASGLLVGYVPGDPAARAAAVDDVSVYGVALSAERISTHFGAGVLEPKAAIDAPVALDAPTVTANGSSATVTWQPPTSTVGVERYEVTVRHRDDGTVFAVYPAMSTSTATVVTGLGTGVAYLFSVAVVNTVGAGPESPDGAATTIAALATGLPRGPLGPTVPPTVLTGDTTWGPEHSPYLVHYLRIEVGATLTILPGTVVKLDEGNIYVEGGQLVAVGTPDKPVVFTSINDDTVAGDTNGSSTTPARGDWYGIEFEHHEAHPSLVSVFDHVEFRYGHGGSTPSVTDGVISNDGAKVAVMNSRFHDNWGGVGSFAAYGGGGGWTSVTHNVFTNNHFGVRPEVQTDVIGNVFASSNYLAVRLNFGGIGVRIAYNDFYAEPLYAFDDLSDEDILITRNNIWAEFQQTSYYAYPSLVGNWWGRRIGAAPSTCLHWIQDNPENYFPPYVISDPDGVCPGNWAPIVGYKWDILPALDAPITTWDTAASSDSAVPTAGPVDTANGVLRYEVTDLELNDAGQAMNVRRMYRSDKGSGVLGKGWSTNYSASMMTSPNGTRSVDFVSGASMRFQPTGQGEPGVPASMTTSATGATVTSSDSSSYSFDAAGVLTGQTLRDPDHKVELTRAGGKVTEVVGVSGRRFTLGYDGSSLSSVSDSAGRNVGYTVTGDRLTQVARAGGGNETYGYDASGRLTSITTPLGREVLKAGYDAEGRVAWYEQGGAGRATIEYHPAERYTIVHQPDGVDVRQEYDKFKRMMRQVVVGGRTNHIAIGVGSVPAVYVNGLPAEGANLAPEVTATRLDYNGNPVEQVDGEGRVVQTTFDSKARPLVTTYADGGTISRHYDAKGRVESVADPAGKTWLADYNGFGQVTKVTDPLLRTQRSVYEANGDLDEQYAVGNLKTAFATDAVGRVTSVIDPLGHEATTTYTAWNGVRSQSTPRGAVTTTTFDDDRNPLTATAAMGRTTTLTYDVFGRVKTIKDAEDNVTTLHYDEMSRVKEIAASNNGKLTRTYSADGDVKTAVDALLRQTAYDYDNLGNLAKVTDATNVATVQTYDQSGRMLTRKIGQQTAEIRTYDTKGRLKSVKAPRGATVTTTYDKLDRPVTVTDSVRGVVVTRTFDDAGRLETETNPLGNTATFGYDAGDRLESVDDEIGRVFLRTFDDAGRLLTDEDGIGFKTIRTYDDDGNVATEKNAGDNGVTTYETDLAGRVTAVVDPVGRRTEIDYDDLDRVVARRTGTAGRLTESFTYDAAGNRLTHTDRAGELWQWAYDTVNQLTTATTPEGGVTAYEYDLAGRLKKTTDADGVVSNTGYDASGRPFKTTDGAGAAWVTTYDVDALPAKTTDPDGVSITYGYDTAGRVLTTKDALNEVTTMTYDAADNVLTRKDPLQHTRTSEYDGRGRQTASIDALGGRKDFTFDDADHLTWTSDSDGTGAGVTYGLTGRPAFFEDEEVRRYVPHYDLAGQMTSMSIPSAPLGGGGDWSWTYDDVGNVETESIDTITTGFEYDGEGRVTEVTKPSGRVTTITRDDDGRLLSETAVNPSTNETAVRSRTYTAAGRLETAVSAEGTTEWDYNALGLLTDSTTAEGPSALTYTPGHRVKTTTVNTRAATTSAYDTRGLLTSLDGPVTQSYTYDDAQRLTKIAYASPEAGVETFAWDDADRLLLHEQKTSSAAATAQLSESYEYTLGGRVKREKQVAPGRGVSWDKSFAYDTLGRLVSQVTTAADGSKTTEAYAWDDRGNRSAESVYTTSPTGEVTPVSSASYYHDVAGRITSGVSATYDADGNMLVAPDGSLFSYDPFGQVSTVGKATPTGTVEATYGRDGLGRMVRRTEGAATSSFTYDGTSIDVSEQKTGT
ncbi:MAG TPA: LamG-like jellyroll fold domain-containing protein, partial [Frankiaceae bacterium]|nr:LamG-like jellyroll fold domain-containing protein [Frankiaceae bacterium]